MQATLRPRDLGEALAARAAHPDAVPIAGGTDLMVQITFGGRRPPGIIDLTAVPELTEWWRDGDDLVIGAGVPFTRIITEAGDLAPGLAAAARTVGSPQIRNRGTLGGNLATASPAGDGIPPLVAAGARVELASAAGERTVPAAAFCTGPKRNVLAPGELVRAVRIPVRPGGQQFAKVGTRNAMVIAVCSLSVHITPDERRVGTGIGSAAPTVVAAGDAERFLEGVLAERGLWESGAPLTAAEAHRFGELVAEAASPIDDVRGTAAYRRHALSVLGRRLAAWAWDDCRGAVG